MSISDVEHELKRFEKAAIDSQGLRYSEAQKVLLEFENIQKPYQFFIQVLENSTITLALYYAATFMNRTLIREWPILEENEKQSLRDFLINYLAERNETLEQSVKNQLLHCFSVLQKRIWMESNHNIAEASINLLKQMMEHNTSTKELALRIMLNMVNEFSFSRSSDIGMSFEFHYKTRISFQKTILKEIFTICFQSIMNHAPDLNTVKADDRMRYTQLLRVALKLLEQILGWDFSEFSLSNTFTKAREQQQQQQALGQVRLKPSGQFVGVINDVSVLKGLFDVSSIEIEDPECVHSIYQSLIQMGTVPMNCFQGEDHYRDYYSLYIKGILHLISSCLTNNGEIANNSHDEETGHKIHTISHMVSAAMITLGVRHFLSLPDSHTAINQLGQFTLTIIRASSRSLDEWFIESSEQLLSAWSFIVDQLELIDKSQLPQQQQLQLLVECCNAFFYSFVESRLRYNTNNQQQQDDNGFEDDGDHEEYYAEEEFLIDEQLDALSTIGRQDPENSFAFLKNSLQSRIEEYQRIISSGAVAHSMDLLMDDMEWLLFIGGYVVADDEDGETNLIPENIILTTSRVGEKSSLFGFIECVFNLGEFETYLLQNGSDFISSAVAKKIAWFLRRWSSVYLIPDENHYPNFSAALSSMFGAENLQLVNRLVNKTVQNMFHWRHDQDVLHDTFKLLSSLVESRFVRSALVKTEAWQSLATEESNTHSELVNLPSEHRRVLMHALCCAYASMHPQLTDLLTPLAQQLRSIVNDESFSNNSQHPSVMNQVLFCLERCRGVALAATSLNVKVIQQFMHELIPIFVNLVNVYHNFNHILVVLLNLFSEIVEYMGPHLPESETSYVFRGSMEVIQLYEQYHASLFQSRALKEETEEDQFQDVTALLKLLRNMTAKDFLDFADDAEVRVHHNDNENDINTGQIVLYGLNHIIPLITIDLLKLPQLYYQFFDLLSFLMDVYTEHVAALEYNTFQKIMSTIEFGVQHHETDIVRMCVDSIECLARYHVTHHDRDLESLDQAFDIVNNMLNLLFNKMLFDDFDLSLVSGLSRALFALIIWDHAKFKTKAENIITENGNNQQLRNAFDNLLNDVQPSLDRKNISKFQNNFEQFLVISRAILHTK